MQTSLKAFAIMLVLPVGALLTGSAEAENGGGVGPCSSRTAIIESLARDYRELPVSVGVMANGNVLQVFSSPESRTWTIISTTPQGMSCVVAAGQSWEIDMASLGPAA